MKIRSRIILVVLPVIIVTLFLAEAASYFSAFNGITRIARQLLTFKARELEKYAGNQWSLLTENNFASNEDMVGAAKKAVENYARSIILSDTEIILALDDSGSPVMSTSKLLPISGETERLLAVLKEENEAIFDAYLDGKERTIKSFYFTPFQWHILLTEEKVFFYRDVYNIRFQTLAVLAAALTLASVTLILFALRLTNPLGRVIATMNSIIAGADLASRVEVEYHDETGKLASAFNHMLGELEKAYAEIKRYAFDAVLAGKKEQRVRQIFQKYVPKDVIDKCFTTQGSMLKIGEDRNLTILFSDIRGFTTISEKFRNNPEDLVESLNRYFSGQVDIIMNRNGIVDKYIGDAIMAFWGAPVNHDDDCLQSVLSGLDMIDALSVFNAHQRRTGKPEFQIGIGINYGLVTVGNIGSERKMDYTVIGDEVNLASRMEGLTKTYHSELLITEYVYKQLKMNSGSAAPPSFRLLDKVAVKGKKEGIRILAVKRNLNEEEKKAWACHNKGMELYFSRDFEGAFRYFHEVLKLIPGDFNATSLLERCKTYRASPPPSDWDGVEVMQIK
ncbi:MAG: adenylate/guanylate cyclase domain-containing protein [Treponema sp.]|jgi:class 3 adenylate cyclase/HAMP domain-containing protein|nr:adenylate/guanylate cyclase domain-containing protein [Treponema sp.]